MFLWSAQEFQEVDLVLPDGGRMHYVRIFAGHELIRRCLRTHDHADDVLQVAHQVERWRVGPDVQGRHALRSSASRRPSRRSATATATPITLTYSGTGRVWRRTSPRLDSPNGRWIEFSYDGSSRVTQAQGQHRKDGRLPIRRQRPTVESDRRQAASPSTPTTPAPDADDQGCPRHRLS